MHEGDGWAGEEKGRGQETEERKKSLSNYIIIGVVGDGRFVTRDKQICLDK